MATGAHPQRTAPGRSRSRRRSLGASTFLVVDAAQRSDGSWVIIETNDAQESGYCGVSPAPLWRAILEAEQP